jgi:hypothetical protein
LTQILTWEARCDEVDFGQRLQRPNIVFDWNARKSSSKHSLGHRIVLAQKLDFVSCGLQAELDAANAGEEPDYPHWPIAK